MEQPFELSDLKISSASPWDKNLSAVENYFVINERFNRNCLMCVLLEMLFISRKDHWNLNFVVSSSFISPPVSFLLKNFPVKFEPFPFAVRLEGIAHGIESFNYKNLYGLLWQMMVGNVSYHRCWRRRKFISLIDDVKSIRILNESNKIGLINTEFFKITNQS